MFVKFFIAEALRSPSSCKKKKKQKKERVARLSSERRRVCSVQAPIKLNEKERSSNKWRELWLESLRESIRGSSLEDER